MDTSRNTAYNNNNIVAWARGNGHIKKKKYILKSEYLRPSVTTIKQTIIFFILPVCRRTRSDDEGWEFDDLIKLTKRPLIRLRRTSFK